MPFLRCATYSRCARLCLFWDNGSTMLNPALLYFLGVNPTCTVGYVGQYHQAVRRAPSASNYCLSLTPVAGWFQVLLFAVIQIDWRWERYQGLL